MQSTSIYDWETLLSNTTTAQILLRWMLAMVALRRGYFLGVGEWQNIGTSSLANSYHFQILPVLLLPRMKMSLVAFWTSGAQFEDQQKAFSDAWYLVYPSIGEVMLCYYGLLNTFGKLARLCASDKPFGATLLLLCLLYWSREMVAFSGWLGVDGRISTAFYADELQELTLAQLLTMSVARRINGNLKSVFFVKVGILAANLIPLIFSLLGAAPKGAAFAQMSRIETILSLRVRNSGGLGSVASRTNAVFPAKPVQGDNLSALSQYELTKLGYVVYGSISTDAETFLIALDDWFLLTQLAPLRRFTNLWNHRVKLFQFTFGSLMASGLSRVTQNCVVSMIVDYRASGSSTFMLSQLRRVLRTDPIFEECRVGFVHAHLNANIIHCKQYAAAHRLKKNSLAYTFG